jgi:hypothetical protein
MKEREGLFLLAVILGAVGMPALFATWAAAHPFSGPARRTP